MRSLLRKLGRLLRKAAIATVIVGVVRALMGKKRSEVTGEASWPPLVDDDKPAAAPTKVVDSEPKPVVAEAHSDGGWVAPVDGTCPASHPIKGNAQSKIFHVPEGASYDRTVAERCYASAEAAEADGFRAAKR
jgi:hypothetical protein